MDIPDYNGQKILMQILRNIIFIENMDHLLGVRILWQQQSSLLYDDGSVTINIPGGPAGTDIYYKITAKDYSNYESDYSNSVSCNVKGQEIEKTGSFGTEVVDNYVLTQNYPNPFNPTTNLKYSVKEKGFVSLKVYDLLGKEVADLVNEDKDIGHHSVNFNASELPSGIYIYSIKVNDFSKSNKVLLLK